MKTAILVELKWALSVTDVSVAPKQRTHVKTSGSRKRLLPVVLAPALAFAIALALSLGLVVDTRAKTPDAKARPAAQTRPVASVEAQETRRPRVGLVLGGGGARAFAHVGVLQVLEEHRVPVDAIVGSSLGAVVGGLYASGIPPDRIAQTLASIDWSTTSGGDFSLLMNSLVRHADGVADLSRLPIPFSAVATDLETGERTWLVQGPLSRAMRASYSATGVIQPLRLNGRLLADGALVDSLPVDAARRMGAAVLIVVDVGAPLVRSTDLSTPFGLSQQIVGLMAEQNAARQLASLGVQDLLIRPELGDQGLNEFIQPERAYALGRQAAQKAVAHLKALALSLEAYRAYRAERGLKSSAEP